MRTDEPPRRIVALAILTALLTACNSASGRESQLLKASVSTSGAPSTSTSTSTSTTTTPTTVVPVPTIAADVTQSVQAAADEPADPADPAPAPATSAASRTVHEQAWAPFATAGGVTLRHPSSRVELIGFHESNLDGARQLDPLPTAAPSLTLEARSRDTGSRTAADVVVDPDTEIRAPVTGTVLQAGSYILYCRHNDNFLIIEPDDHPGWEVKLLHFEGLVVGVGSRVVAGETVVGSHARQLPFRSQVDKVTSQPPWPHVHVEIDDPTIPDRPTGDGC